MLIVSEKKKSGSGLINSLIDSLPFEAHIPGYSYCGPGTRIEERLKKNDPPVNSLDARCKTHDIFYLKNQDLESRHRADRELADQSWKIAGDSSKPWGERAAAYLVTNAMKSKLALGGKLKKKRGGKLKKKRAIKRKPRIGKGVKSRRRKVARKVKLVGPRVIPLPKTGGILQYLYPILTGLTHIGSAAGTANDFLKSLQKMKKGGGMQKKMKLAPFKKGWGLYLKPYEPKNC